MESKMILSKDDYELMLKQMKSQRSEHMCALFLVEAGIMRLENIIKNGNEGKRK